MKSKILFVLPKFEFGGTVFSTFNMIRVLGDFTDYDIYIYPMIADGPVRNVYTGLNVLPSDFLLESNFANINEYSGRKKVKIYLGKLIKRINLIFNKQYNQDLFRRVAEQLQRKYNFDFVASCQEGDSTEFVSYFPNCKRIAWFRSEMSVYLQKHISKEKAKLLNSIYCKFNNIVCVSNTTREDFAQYFPAIGERIIAIHNIQDTQDINNRANQLIRDPFDNRFFTIVSVGRMSPQKRFAQIPSIASKLITRGNKNFRWYIIGDGNTGGEYDRLLDEIDKLDMKEYVIPIGSRVNPYPYIKSADILVIPSSYEACPRVVAEAHILNKPVISADYSSATEFVNHGVDGFVSTIDNLDYYISAMMKKDGQASEIYSNCESFHFDSDSILQKLLKLFSK